MIYAMGSAQAVVTVVVIQAKIRIFSYLSIACSRTLKKIGAKTYSKALQEAPWYQ